MTTTASFLKYEIYQVPRTLQNTSIPFLWKATKIMTSSLFAYKKKILDINKTMISGRVLGLFLRALFPFNFLLNLSIKAFFGSLLFQHLRFQNMASDYS